MKNKFTRIDKEYFGFLEERSIYVINQKTVFIFCTSKSCLGKNHINFSAFVRHVRTELKKI